MNVVWEQPLRNNSFPSGYWLKESVGQPIGPLYRLREVRVLNIWQLASESKWSKRENETHTHTQAHASNLLGNIGKGGFHLVWNSFLGKLLLPICTSTVDRVLCLFGEWWNLWIIWNCSGHYGETNLDLSPLEGAILIRVTFKALSSNGKHSLVCRSF